MRRLALTAVVAVAVGFAPRPAHATFVIVNLNNPGEGFNDPTPVAPVGGNPGTTVGQQRLNAFVKAGQIWDALLADPQTIYVAASFDTLPCGVTSGVLGAAGPYVVDANFPARPFVDTWYAGAEADRLQNADLDPGNPDIEAEFNTIVGTPTCLTSRYWYYGYDGNEGANGIDLLPVLLHEFGHGLGFLTFTDDASGAFYTPPMGPTYPSIFDRYLLDTTTGKHWIDMTDGERVASAINTTHLVWDGPAVTSAAPHVLGNRAHVVTSGALVADDVAGQGVFSPPITAGGVTGDIALVNDGSGTTSDGCQTPFVNAGAVSGHIALMDRSAGCSFAQQALDAQSAGAIAAIIINNVAGPEPQLRGSAPTVTIPVASLSLPDGNAIRTALGSGIVHATIALDPAHLAGADNSGRVMMYAPNPDQPGSSVSHWDVAAFPNLLMEPSINPDLTQNVDLAYHLFSDIGWFPQLAAVAPEAGVSPALAQAPNPTSEGGELRFRLAQGGPVELALFDVSGRRVTIVASGPMTAGEHALRWSRRDGHGHRVPAGVYLVRLKAGDTERTTTIVLVD